MDWELKINKSAKKYLEKIETKKKDHILQDIRNLKNWVENRSNPILDIKTLNGRWEGKFRLRTGNIRVIFEILLSERQIKILYIGPRGDVYQ